MPAEATGGESVPRFNPVIESMLAADASLRGAGITVTAAANGEATATMTVAPNSLNGHGRVHGGLIFMLADTAFACAANTACPPAVTASADIAFLSTAQVGEMLTATAAVRTVVGRTGVVDVTVRSGARIIAEYRGRSITLRPPFDSRSVTP